MVSLSKRSRSDDSPLEPGSNQDQTQPLEAAKSPSMEGQNEVASNSVGEEVVVPSHADEKEVVEASEIMDQEFVTLSESVVADIVPPSEVPSSTVTTLEGMHSRINGAGLWSSWQRNFKTPELALLDLFDNAVDATLHDGFLGEISIYKDPAIDPDEDDAHGICLRNNCARRIPDLPRVLEVFGSSKDQVQIGENGVGTKQACAALSDLSIILTKNKEKISIGILFKALQMDEGCRIPSFEFRFQTLETDFAAALVGSEELRMALETYGEGDIGEGRERVVSHMMFLKSCDDDYIFLVILHRIIHRGTDGGIDGMLNNMAKIICRNYLHIPPEFQVFCGKERLIFQYWERRLAELHHFPIRIDPTHDFNCAADWHMPHGGHEFNLFIGFDPVRAKVQNKNKTSLLFYSRKSGRLVKEIEDARGILGLISGGTDFAQGLTVILDDNLGRLPLTPTKQDLAFGNEPTGKVHEGNLLAWIGAFTHLYYQYFLEKCKSSKAALGAEVQRHIHAIKALGSVAIHETLKCGDFSTFHHLSFSRDKAKGKIRCCNKQKSVRKPGKATRISFGLAVPRPAPKKRAPTVASVPNHRVSENVEKRPPKRKKVVEATTSTSKGGTSDDNLISRLQGELNSQKIYYDTLLKVKDRKIEKLEKESHLSLEEIPSGSGAQEGKDGPAQMRLEALRRRCDSLESEILASRDLKIENEKLRKQVEAQKTYILSLQNLNDSLRNLSNL